MGRLGEPCVECGMETALHKRCTAGRASRAQKRASEDGLRCPNTLVPLDFEPREFDPMNGAGGRVPLLMEEFEKIGLQNPIGNILFCRQRHQGLSFAAICLRLP